MRQFVFKILAAGGRGLGRFLVGRFTWPPPLTSEAHTDLPIMISPEGVGLTGRVGA